MTFTLYEQASPLYYAPYEGRGNGFIVFLLYPNGVVPATLTLEKCFDPSQSKGYFIFLSGPPADPGLLLSRLKSWLGPIAPDHTGIGWLKGNTKSELILLNIATDGRQLEKITGSWGRYSLFLPAGSLIFVTQQDGTIGLGWEIPPEITTAYYLPQDPFLAFEGRDRGLLLSNATIGDFSDSSPQAWNVGIQYFIPAADGTTILSQYYPVFNPEEGLQVLFKLSWDFIDASRNQLLFTGFSFLLLPDDSSPGGFRITLPPRPGRMQTWLRTDMGRTIFLSPLDESVTRGRAAKLVMLSTADGSYYWVPDGGFEISIADEPVSPTIYYMLCGFSGTETVSFRPKTGNSPGDILYFQSGLPAYVYNFPPPGNDSTSIDIDESPELSMQEEEQEMPSAPPGNLYAIYVQGKETPVEEESPLLITTMNTATGPTGPFSSYLNNTYQTSWMSITPFAGPTGATGVYNYYFAQPDSSPLYGGGTGGTGQQWHAGITGSNSSFLEFYRPPSAGLYQAYSGNIINFPLAPIAGAIEIPDAGKIDPQYAPPCNFLSVFEQQVLVRARSEQLLSNPAFHLPYFKSSGINADATYSTSPQGLLVKIPEQSFQWQQLLFAGMPANASAPIGPHSELSFNDLSEPLQTVFQQKKLFLVMSLMSTADLNNFANEITIQDWPFQLNVSDKPSTGNYKNVLIFKFIPGKIKDLITTYEEWTSADSFNTNPRDLSAWISNYIAASSVHSGFTRYTVKPGDTMQRIAAAHAISEDRIYYCNKHIGKKLSAGTVLNIPPPCNMDQDQPSLYQYFEEVVNSDTWTGILALKVDINLQDFPDQIKGLLGGIDLSKFNAHHFGIEVNQVVPDPVHGGLMFAEPSSLFGLIDYKDPTPNTGMPYDFKVNLLQVLFSNSAIADFRCCISLTIASIFGEAISITPPPQQPYTINLKGTYEDHEGVATYSFLADAAYELTSLKNVVWSTITISKTQFFTLSQQNNSVSAAFSFWGVMSFNDISSYCKGEFDLFSFDKLAFSGMQLLMDFDIPAKPVSRPPLLFTFDPSGTSFASSASVARPASLFKNFAVSIKGMAFGSATNLPNSKGYYPIELPLLQPANINSVWYALRYDLDLGTPGALAAQAGFVASVLACWTPADLALGTQMGTYLQLPNSGGTFQTVLQSVLTLSIGDAQFLNASTNKEDPPVYELALKSISLKVLGFLSIPPGGTTDAYLFSNVDPGDARSSTGWYIAYKSDDEEQEEKSIISIT